MTTVWITKEIMVVVILAVETAGETAGENDSKLRGNMA
jgi:hypothetical protein